MNTTVNAAIDHALEKATFLYENVPIQTAVKSIPVIGPGLEAIFDGRLEQAREQRVRDWLRLVVGGMKALDEEKVDKAFLESHEFLALFMRTAKEAADCWEKEKLSVFAQFLANGVVKGAYPGARERILAIIANLQMGHIVVLKDLEPWTRRDSAAIFEYATGEAPRGALEERFPGMTINEVIGFLVDVEAKGLVQRHGQSPITVAGVEQAFPWSLLTEQGFVVLDYIRGAGPRERRDQECGENSG